MELRDIEIFLTLAEELHFGRTAERLNVTPARITQAIKKQERQIGALLFERTNRSVRLTPLGEQLRRDLRPVYAGLAASMQRAKLAARGKSALLRLGLMPFNTTELRRYWDEFRLRQPDCELRIRRCPYVDPFGTLRSGEFDALVVWLPVAEPDLTVGPVLFTDDRILAVSEDHELAGLESVSVEMLADFRHVTAPRMPDYWEGAYLPFHTPAGRPILRDQIATNSDELIEMVGTGDIVHAFPAHVIRYWAVPHLRWIPVPDMPPLPYALVWRTAAETEPIRRLAAVIRDLQ
ncbi:LysR family transcriptional regulator [Nocardia crassostreae]|uniref:LysR family transcriptional regulator n=1 Tax=Nocardia crassostreae TaxID=53428 RepID=UPI0008354A46|nr:LysR family transcriptional regulator [Nocardia crassostreae]